MKILKRLIGLLICVAGVAAIMWPDSRAARGKLLYEKQCIDCHSLDENRIGPAHRGVFGRKAGMAPGFAYSDALKNATIVWSDDTLDAWLKNPGRLIPGQRMSYSVPGAQDRLDLIAFLKTLSEKR